MVTIIMICRQAIIITIIKSITIINHHHHHHVLPDRPTSQHHSQHRPEHWVLWMFWFWHRIEWRFKSHGKPHNVILESRVYGSIQSEQKSRPTRALNWYFTLLSCANWFEGRFEFRFSGWILSDKCCQNHLQKCSFSENLSWISVKKNWFFERKI